MRTMIRLTVAAAAIALGAAAIQPAHAADMLVPQAQAPAPAYYPPPAQAYAYPPPPPPVAYYAPPPVAYYAPAYAVWPGPGPRLLCALGLLARLRPALRLRLWAALRLWLRPVGARQLGPWLASLSSNVSAALTRPLRGLPLPHAGEGKNRAVPYRLRDFVGLSARRPVGKREPNAFPNALCVVDHIAIPEAHDPPTGTCEKAGTVRVINAVCVLRAIDLHDQPVLD